MKLPTPTRRRAMIADAVRIVGTQQKLSKAAGISQQAISQMLKNPAYGVSVTAAMKIDKATKGKVSKAALRPDIFGVAD